MPDSPLATSKPAAWLPYVLLVSLAFIWGSSFILMKHAMVVFTPGQVAALRMAIAGAVFLPVAMRHIGMFRKRWAPLLAVGFIGSGIPAILFTAAEVHISSGLAGALNSVTPLFTLLIAVFMFRVRIGVLAMVGVLVGLAGAWVLMLAEGAVSLSGAGYGLLVVLACLCYAVNVNVIKKYFQDVPGMVSTALSLLPVATCGIVYLLYSGAAHTLATVPGAWLAFAYAAILALMGTATAMLLYTRLIQITTPVFASSVTYLMPIVALAWGLLDREPLNLWHAAGLLLVLAGVWAVNKKPKIRVD